MLAQDSIQRIQAEAKRKAAETLAKLQGSVAERAEPPKKRLDVEVLQQFADEVASDFAKAISAKAARNYAGDAVTNMQDIATNGIQQVQLNDFGDKVIYNEDGTTSLYPDNCRFFIQESDKSKLNKHELTYGAILIEEPPQLRTIFREEKSDRMRGTFPVRIPLPYLSFLISFCKKNGKYYAGSCGIGFSAKPLNTIDDTIYTPMLPHCDPNGNCQPGPPGGENSITELVNSYLSVFWNSSFVYAFRPFSILNGKEKTVISSFEEWASLKNPLDILKADFAGFSQGYSARLLLERFSHGKGKTNIANHVEKYLRGIVKNLTNAVNVDELTETIHVAAQDIVNAALKKMFEKHDLQTN